MGNKTKSLLSSYHGKKRRLTSIVSEKMSYEKELLENRINDGIVEYTPIITPIHNKNMPFYYFYKFVLLKKFDAYIGHLFKYLDLDHQIDPDKLDYIIEFIAGGLFQMLIHWLKNGMKESNPSMGLLATEFIKRKIPSL